MKKSIFALVELLKQEHCPVAAPTHYLPISRPTLPLPPCLTPSELTQVKQGVAEAQSSPALAQALSAGQALIQAKAQIHWRPTGSEWPLAGVTRHSSRANLSFLQRQTGLLELPESRPSSLPAVLEVPRWRQYCLVQDGVLHLSSLEARLTFRAWSEIQGAGVDLGAWAPDQVWTIPLSPFSLEDTPGDLGRLPLLLWAAERARAQIKAIRSLQTRQDPLAHLRQAYGEEAAEWLQYVGVSDSGYAPRSESLPARAFYLAPALQSRIKGQSIPSVSALGKKISSGKPLTRGEQVLADLLEGERRALAGKTPEEGQEILSLRRQSVESLAKSLDQEIQQALWTILVGREWFPLPGVEWGQKVLLEAPDGDQVEVSVREEQVRI